MIEKKDKLFDTETAKETGIADENYGYLYGYNIAKETMKNIFTNNFT